MVPYVDELDAVDSRLMGLAEFLGIQCESFPLDQITGHNAEYIERAVPDRHACLVVNPRVLQRWVGGGSVPPELVSCLVSRFAHLLVHGMRIDSFDASVSRILIRRTPSSVDAIGGEISSIGLQRTQRILLEPSGARVWPDEPHQRSCFRCLDRELRSLAR